MKKHNNIIPQLSEEIEFNQLSSYEYILSNSFHNHYLKINREVYNLLSLINGYRNLSEICSIFNSNYGKNVSEKDLETLLYKKFIHYGILKGFESKIKEYKKPPYLKMSFIIINENILSKIVKNFYFLFNKKNAIYAIIISSVIIGVQLFLNIDLYKSFDLQDSLIYFFTVMTLSVTFHEIGHATSTSYFGAKHGGIGGGFYLFTPVYYADVTDIWRLKKTQRIIVNLSGMYFELIFCSILVLMSILLDDYMLTVTALVVFLHTFSNLNPFLRSDGYWILSDLTNKPNLFYHSIGRIKDVFYFIRSGKCLSWNKIDVLLLLYGLISTLFIGFFLYYVLIKNPNSILMFPHNLKLFFLSIIDNNSSVSLAKYGELIVPLIFILLTFRLIKTGIKKIYEKYIL